MKSKHLDRLLVSLWFLLFSGFVIWGTVFFTGLQGELHFLQDSDFAIRYMGSLSVLLPMCFIMAIILFGIGVGFCAIADKVANREKACHSPLDNPHSYKEI